jgi:elongation factor 1-beta
LLLWNGLTSSSYGASQADVASFKAIPSPPKVEKYPNAYRWYNHIKSYEPEFSTLPGDPSKGYTTYGPEAVQVTSNVKDAPEDEEEDLFGSDEEEEDPEVVAERERRLADYRKKKEGKAKPAAKSIVTMDVKPWGELYHIPPEKG